MEYYDILSCLFDLKKKINFLDKKFYYLNNSLEGIRIERNFKKFNLKLVLFEVKYI